MLVYHPYQVFVPAFLSSFPLLVYQLLKTTLGVYGDVSKPFRRIQEVEGKPELKCANRLFFPLLHFFPFTVIYTLHSRSYTYTRLLSSISDEIWNT